MSSPEISYTASVMSTGGRHGRVISADGSLDIQLCPPTAEHPGGETGTNPEELFAAAMAACFNAAVQEVAGREDFDASGCIVKAHVSLGAAAGSYALALEILVAIPGESLEDVQRLARAAEEACPYAAAVRGNVELSVHAVEA